MTTDVSRVDEAAPSTAAVVLRTARAALQISADEMAEDAGCGVSLVHQIESGGHDPVIDTVGRLVNVVGLELRCGGGPEPNPAYLRVDPGEVARLAGEIARTREFWAQFGIEKLPLPSLQIKWDGNPPAPPHLFGAGRGRRHEGGWAALLMGPERALLGLTEAEMADAAGISASDVDAIESGGHRPPMSEVQRILASVGVHLRVRLEMYEDHDDGLHHRALEDPEGLERTLRYNKKVFASAVVIS